MKFIKTKIYVTSILWLLCMTTNAQIVSRKLLWSPDMSIDGLSIGVNTSVNAGIIHRTSLTAQYQLFMNDSQLIGDSLVRVIVRGLRQGQEFLVHYCVVDTVVGDYILTLPQQQDSTDYPIIFVGLFSLTEMDTLQTTDFDSHFARVWLFDQYPMTSIIGGQVWSLNNNHLVIMTSSVMSIGGVSLTRKEYLDNIQYPTVYCPGNVTWYNDPAVDFVQCLVPFIGPVLKQLQGYQLFLYHDYLISYHNANQVRKQLIKVEQIVDNVLDTIGLVCGERSKHLVLPQSIYWSLYHLDDLGFIYQTNNKAHIDVYLDTMSNGKYKLVQLAWDGQCNKLYQTIFEFKDTLFEPLVQYTCDSVSLYGLTGHWLSLVTGDSLISSVYTTGIVDTIVYRIDPGNGYCTFKDTLKVTPHIFDDVISYNFSPYGCDSAIFMVLSDIDSVKIGGVLFTGNISYVTNQSSIDVVFYRPCKAPLDTTLHTQLIPCRGDTVFVRDTVLLTDTVFVRDTVLLTDTVYIAQIDTVRAPVFVFEVTIRQCENQSCSQQFTEIFPNPTMQGEVVTIKTKNCKVIRNVSLVTMNGITLGATTLRMHTVGSEYQLAIPHGLSQAFYLLKLEFEDGTLDVHKIVVQ